MYAGSVKRVTSQNKKALLKNVLKCIQIECDCLVNKLFRNVPSNA